MKFPEIVDEGPLPKKMRKALNVNSKLAKRPWTITFSPQNQNKVHQTDEKVVIEITSINVTICVNGRPKRFAVAGKMISDP